MADFILRPAVETDREQIIKIWHKSFGDSPEFISDMLSCGLFATALGAETEGALRSVMFAFDGLKAGCVPSSYLLALCTDPDYRGRGFGKAVALYAAESAVERGAQAVFLRPADAGLERWYSESLGARTVARCAAETFRVSPGCSVKAREISACEYLRLRRGCWELSRDIVEAQSFVHRHFGGAFLAAGDSLLCVENSCGRPLVREIISASPETALRAAADFFGSESLEVLRPSTHGAALMLMPGLPSITECCFLPFTFD